SGASRNGGPVRGHSGAGMNSFPKVEQVRTPRNRRGRFERHSGARPSRPLRLRAGRPRSQAVGTRARQVGLTRRGRPGIPRDPPRMTGDRRHGGRAMRWNDVYIAAGLALLTWANPVHAAEISWRTDFAA